MIRTHIKEELLDDFEVKEEPLIEYTEYKVQKHDAEDRNSIIVKEEHGGQCSNKEIPENYCDSKNFTCASCRMTFNSKQSLKRHKSSVHKRQYTCDQCKYKTKVFSSLKSHMKLHQTSGEVRKFICFTCEESFTQKDVLRRHIFQAHRRCHCLRSSYSNRRIKCFFSHKTGCSNPEETKLKLNCDENTPAKTNDSYSEKNSNERFVCYTCARSYNQKASLKQHIFETHRLESIYSCKHCSYTTSKKNLMLSHKDKHKDLSSDKIYVCNECGLKSKYRRNIVGHMKLHNPNVTPKIHECKKCNFKTIFKYCLDRHLRSRAHLIVTGKFEEYIPRKT